MEDKLDQKILWVALSELFVDSEVDYKGVAKVARKYSIDEVEFALFERVAPVCVSNMLTPAPPIWWYFDEDQLISNIESLIKKRSGQGFVGKCISIVVGGLIRLICLNVWSRLKAEMEIDASGGSEE
ncbi:DUF7079 family protein [Pseudomonas mohnii]